MQIWSFLDQLGLIPGYCVNITTGYIYNNANRRWTSAMREVNAIISLMGEETEYYVLYSHTPNEAPVWRKTDRRVRSLVTGIATFSQSTLSLKPRKSKSETPVTAGDSGELIRLSVHQVNNELCIVLLPWCHHNNRNCLLPHELMRRMRF